MIEMIKALPDWVIILLAVPAVAVAFLVKPLVNAHNSWRKTKADARKVNAETDLKLIDEYKELLGEFRAAIAEQKRENKQLHADNKRLHKATEQVIEEAERLHAFVKSCLEQLHDAGVPTDLIPRVPDLDIPEP